MSDSTNSLSNQRVLVTGASGFVGSHMIRGLISRGATVACFSRTPGRCADLIGAGKCEFFRGSIERESDCAASIKSFHPDTILHFASRPDAPESVEHAAASIEVNLKGTMNLLARFHRPHGVFVFGDSCKVYGNGEVPHRPESPLDPNSSYAMTKAAAWWMCRIIAGANGFHAVSFRPTLIYGPGQGTNLIQFVMNKALSGADSIPLAGGSQTRDPLYIDDAVEACMRLTERGRELSGRVVTVGGGHEISVSDLAELIVSACGARAQILAQPDSARPTEIWRSWCDNVDARRLLDWSPSVGLREGVLRTLRSLRPA